MQTTSLLKKALAVGIILLFLGAGIIPSTAHISTKSFIPDLKDPTNHDAVSLGDDVNWTFNGTTGKHGCYISPVNATCTYNHSRIAKVYFQYNGSWTMYSEPFTISIQGVVIFSWYAVDHNGNQGATQTITLKIDYTPPYLRITKERIGLFRWRITVDAYDNVSGVDKVELYANGALIGTLTSAPFVFELILKIFEKPIITIVVYDCAGLNTSYSPTTSTVYSSMVMLGNHTIKHFPENGLYWNDRKIREYPIPLYLHYHFRFFARFYPGFYFNISDVRIVEYYVDGNIIWTLVSPPWEVLIQFIVTPFHSRTLGIKVYYNDGLTLSDNVTIYRLFP